jgi:hypothetical protein
VSGARQSTKALGASEIRLAFASGLSLTGAALFLRARDDGLGWEEATRAVAEGLAEHYQCPIKAAPPKRDRRPVLRVLGSGLIAYALVRLVLGTGHELTVAAIAWLLHALVGTNVWEPLIRSIGLDPIYGGAAIRAAGGVQVAGFAIAGSIGGVLHQLLPGLFLGSDHLAGRAAFSMVASPGAPALGRGLAAFGADVGWLTLGLWLFWRWRHRSWLVALIGLFIQTQISIHHLLGAHVRLADIDATGLPFALQVAMPNGGWFTSGLSQLPDAERGLVVGGSLLVLGYVAAALALTLGVAFARVLRRARLPVFSRMRHGPRRMPQSIPSRPRYSTALVSLGLALATACSPIGALAVGSSNWQMSPGSSLDVPVPENASTPGVDPVLPDGPTLVTIDHSSGTSWRYLVDGNSETIRGVGYNPWYASLSPQDRAALYQRDFSAMRRVGINTIEGWFEGQFDSVTLYAAAANGIGVLMPFELNQDWDYTSPNVQASILEHVSAYVEQYKKYPAVRMWAPGNENLHRVLYAHWVSQMNVPAARARADAFAAFLPRLLDRIHELDPNHPVVYRDAEDVYLSWITKAFAQAGGGDRPWLVYGANVYSAARLQQVISNWPNQWPGRPLLISEFAPGGMGPADRPLAFQQDWQIIRSRPDVVLGGLAYTWATNGPEDLDRVFGLVDPSGVPADGALAALSAAYISETRAAAAGSPG